MAPHEWDATAYDALPLPHVEWGRRVLDRMGLTEAVRARHTSETATVIVDGDGEVVAQLPSDGPDGPTAELEVLRGDFARTILDALPAGVELVYGDVIVGIEDSDATVHVRTEGGRTFDAALLVVAEGVRSRTRTMVFPDDEVDARDLGVTMVFGTIPRTPDDDEISGSFGMILNNHNFFLFEVRCSDCSPSV